MVPCGAERGSSADDGAQRESELPQPVCHVDTGLQADGRQHVRTGFGLRTAVAGLGLCVRLRGRLVCRQGSRERMADGGRLARYAGYDQPDRRLAAEGYARACAQSEDRPHGVARQDNGTPGAVHVRWQPDHTERNVHHDNALAAQRVRRLGQREERLQVGIVRAFLQLARRLPQARRGTVCRCGISCRIAACRQEVRRG